MSDACKAAASDLFDRTVMRLKSIGVNTEDERILDLLNDLWKESYALGVEDAEYEAKIELAEEVRWAKYEGYDSGSADGYEEGYEAAGGDVLSEIERRYYQTIGDNTEEHRIYAELNNMT